MPTVHREGGFRFVIWPNDHTPPHVHAFNAEGEAVIELLSRGRVREYAAMRSHDVVAAVRIVLREESRLIQRWSEIHG